MTANRRPRKTKAQVIADLEARLKQLKNKKQSAKAEGLSIESPGMAELAAAFDAALKANKVKGPELFIALAKIKRARVTITPTAKK